MRIVAWAKIIGLMVLCAAVCSIGIVLVYELTGSELLGTFSVWVFAIPMLYFFERFLKRVRQRERQHDLVNTSGEGK